MKHLKTLILLTAVLCLIISCGRSDKTSKDKSKLKKGETEMVTLPFEITALGNYVYFGPDTLPDPKCGEPYAAWRVIVDGSGSGTPIGEFTMHFDFCGDEESKYGNNYGFLLNENGDTLFISCEGQVFDGRLDDHPEFVTSYWKDPFTLTGGSGVFEGASGSGTTDDYNSSEDPYSHHHWVGTITMMKQELE
jgi:hypothetical protein